MTVMIFKKMKIKIGITLKSNFYFLVLYYSHYANYR